MTLFAEHSYSRVMVFIDYRNIYESMRFMEDHCRLDLYRLTQILVGTRDLVGAYVFDARKMFTNREDETIAMHNSLREQGFRVIARESMVIRDGKVEQKEVDVSLACEMLEHALMNHFDVAIVISGDRDFVPAIQKVQSAGKRVEVAAFNDVYNEECKRAADVYYLLDDLPFMSMSSPTNIAGVDYRWRRRETSSITRGSWASPATASTATCTRMRSRSSTSSGSAWT